METGLALGAVDYPTKPVNPAVMLTRVKTHIALSERTQMLSGLSTKLSHYLAPRVYRMIFEGTQDAAIHARRKKQTIFFSDIKDFTATTADMEPEDLTYLLNRYFEEMSKIALEYGATIDKFGGEVNLAARLEQASDPDGILMPLETNALAREEVDAEERPPVALKGITGEVRAFAVKGIFDGFEAERRFVQKVRPGLRAVLDLDHLPPAAREEAIGDLEELINRIRQVG